MAADEWVIESIPGQKAPKDEWVIESIPGQPPAGQAGNPVLKNAPPEDTGVMATIQRTVGDAWDSLFQDKTMDRTKAANAIGISEQTGLPASVVYDNMDKITGDLGLRDQPPFREFAEKIMSAPVTYGLLAHPLATLIGVGAFAALSEAENFASSKFQGRPYQFGAGRGISELLPDDTSQTVKDLFWLTDMAGKAILAGGLAVGGKMATRAFQERYMREVTETYNLPRNVYISPEKIREFHGLGREDVITPDETALLKDINLSRRDYVQALHDGIDIEIPVEKISTIQDKPWVRTLKDAFKISPYEETKVTPAGEPTAKRPIAGELEAPARRGVGDILQDLGTIFAETGKEGPGSERGSVGGPRDMSPEETAARDRLRNDLAVVKQKAAEAGRDLGAFLKENGLDEAAVSSVLAIDALKTSPEVGGIQDLPAKGVVYRTATNREKLRTDPDWKPGKSAGDMEAARRFAARNWEDAKTEKLLELVDNPTDVLFIAQPSTSTHNVHPLALAERISGEIGGHHVAGRDFFKVLHAQESKKVAPSDRAFYPRDYTPRNIEELRSLADGKEVVVVDDIYTSGGSAAAFIRALQKEGIPVKAHVGYFGEARLRPDPRTVDSLQRTLRNAGIPVKGGELAKHLTMREVGGIIQNINRARSENAKRKIAEDLQGVLDRGTTANPRNAAVKPIPGSHPEGENLGDGRSDIRIPSDAGASTQPSRSSNPQETATGSLGPPEAGGPSTTDAALRPLSEILKDILSAFSNLKGPKGQRGSFSNKEASTPEAKAARDRLAKDFEVLKTEAKQAGRDVFDYMVENGVNPESATYMINAFGTVAENTPVESVNDLLDMAARQDQAQHGGVMPDNPSYDAIRQRASELAFDKIQKKIDFKKRRETAAISRQAMEDARQDPVVQIMNEVVKGGGLNKGALDAVYDKDTVKELMAKRPGIVSKSGKYTLDTLASEYGIESDDVLMNAMIDHPGIGAVAEKIKGQFEEQYSALLSEMDLNDFYLDLLTEEAAILGKLLKGNAPKPALGLKHVIREETGQLRVDELMISEYDALKAGMKKAEQASRAAFREGKINGALAEKIKERDIARRLKARLEAKEEVNGIRAGILKIMEDKKVPPEYREQIEDLLSDYDLYPRSEQGRKRVESAREFIERQEAAGEDVSIPKSLMDKIDRYGKIHWREMTLLELRDISDQATMLAHLGKLKSTLLASKKARNYEQAVKSVVGAITKNWPARDAGNAETMLLDPSGWEKAKEQGRQYLAELTKPEFLFRRLDKWEEQGPVWEALYQPIKAASDAEITAMLPIVEKLQAIFKPLTKGRGRKWADEKYKIPGVPQIMTKEKMIMVALNTGNEGNMAALREGLSLDDTQIKAITDKLSHEEWQLVRDIWDLYKEQFPELAKVYRALTGAVLKPVEGDYHPLVFDRTLSWVADKNASEAEMRDFFTTIYTKPKPESGFTQARTGGKLPPKLSFDVIFNHLADVNHYTTHVLAVRDVQKIIGDPEVRAAIEASTAAGPEGYRELMPWLQEVAKPRRDPLSITENLLKTLRRNTTAVALGLKFSVAAFQWLGILNTVEEVGVIPTVKAVAEFYTDREALVDQVKAMSPEMTARASSWDRELKDAYGRLGLEHFRGQQAIKDSFFGLITLMDLAVAYPTWLAGYKQGMELFSGDKAKAIEHGDFMVRKTQGTAMPKDLAGIQRGGELKKFVTMFYTFFSAMQNQMAEINGKFKAGEKNVAELAKAWWWVIVAPAVLGYMLKEREIPGPKTAVKEIIQYRLGTYPVIRDMISPAFTDFDYTFSPATRAGEVTSKAIKEAVLIPTGEADFGKLAQYSFEATGYFTGLPTAQALITIKGFNDLKNGETSDLTRLLMREPRQEEE